MKFQDIFPILFLSTNVLAHGGVCYYDIDGVQYNGNLWDILNDTNNDPLPAPDTPSIQKRWTYWPILDPTSTNMSCNYDGSSASVSLHATITAGSNITSHWNNYLPGVWPTGWYHGTGPLLSYLALCPGSCDDWNPVGEKVWFKIDQKGLDPSATDLGGLWEQNDLIFTGNGPAPGYTVTIPPNLKPGNYLLRTEVIMIQADPAQFYPECAQLQVLGEGAAFPDEEDLVAFPGAYNSSDPGISIAAWSLGDGDQPFPAAAYTTDYQFPGPAVWTGGNDE